MQSGTIKSLNVKTEKLVLGWNHKYRQGVAEHIQQQVKVLEDIRKNIEALKNKSNRALCDFQWVIKI